MQFGYHVYVIGEDNHAASRIDIICDGDEEAICYAEQLVDGKTIELWQGTRRVATLKPKGERGAH